MTLSMYVVYTTSTPTSRSILSTGTFYVVFANLGASTPKREKCNQTRYSASKLAKFSLRYVQSSKNFLEGEVVVLAEYEYAL